MYDPIAALRTLVLPYGQPANSPQVLINVDPVPAAIVTYYAANGAFAAPETVVSIPLLAQKDASNYIYTSLNVDTAGEMYYCHGTVDSTNGVNETWRELVPFGFRTGIIYGALPSAGSITQVQYGLDQVQQTAAVIINRSSSYSIDGHSAGRGIIASVTNTTATGNLAATTQWANFGAVTFHDGRVFCLHFEANSFGSVENITIYSAHYTNAAGALIDAHNKENPAGTTLINHTGRMFIKNDTGADLSRTISMCAAPNAGTVQLSFGGNASRAWIEDIGSVSDLNSGLLPVALV